jgi:NHS family xanthosine MFS transporter
MLISMLAWVLRFGLFAYGNPGDGLWMIIMSCVVYGMAFDFFIFQVHYLLKLLPTLEYVLAHRLFMMMSNGFGAFFGGIFSGIVIDNFYSRWS